MNPGGGNWEVGTTPTHPPRDSRARVTHARVKIIPRDQGETRRGGE